MVLDALMPDQIEIALAAAGQLEQENRQLERQWALLEPFSRTYLTVSQSGLNLLALSERHIPILDALRARDPDAAADAMHRHLMDAAELLKEPV